MSLYFRTLYAWKCKGTHHKLAMDALQMLPGEHSAQWRDLFLKHIESYLTGSKDPDTKFKDFRNHVLHVQADYWGGAIEETQKWYAKACQSFADGRWKEAIYATGVMSHYLSDVCCPLHTAQSDKENVMHRACEWSVSCSYDDLVDTLEEDLGGFPKLTLSTETNWLELHLKEQAVYANEKYDQIVEGYRFDLGAKNPPEGLEKEIFNQFAHLLGRAGSSLSLVIGRCLEESKQIPPEVSLSLQTMLANFTIPIFWVTKKMADSKERAIVNKIYEELQRTGSVEESLPEENRVIRDLINQENGITPSQNESSETIQNEAPAQEISPALEYERAFEEEAEAEQDNNSTESTKPASTEPETFEAATPKRSQSSTEFFLHEDDPIVDAPSIGPKTASRFRKVGINRVDDFLNADPEDIVSRLNTRWITREFVTDWQQQAELMCALPGLRGYDAQILTGIGIETYNDMAAMNTEDLFPLISEFVDSSDGQRVLRGCSAPEFEEVSQWIGSAQQLTQNKAA